MNHAQVVEINNLIGWLGEEAPFKRWLRNPVMRNLPTANNPSQQD
jgi:hypothetical protein